VIEVVRHYLISAKYGHQFINESLSRGLRIWIDHCLKNLKQESSSLKNHVNKFVWKSLRGYEPFKLVQITNFLLSRIDDEHYEVVEYFIQCLTKIALAYPYQSVWWIFPLKYFDYPVMSFSKKKEKADRILQNLQIEDESAWRIISSTESFYKELLEFGYSKPNSVPLPLLKGFEPQKSTLILPLRKHLTPLLPSKKFDPQMTFNPFPFEPEFIQSLHPDFTEMKSLQKPRKISFICDETKKIVPFLFKFEKRGDVRKEQRTIDFAEFINTCLQNSRFGEDSDFQMKTFSIIPLSCRLNLSEWLQNTATIKSLIIEEWEHLGIKEKIENEYKLACKSHLFFTDEAWSELTKIEPVFDNFFWSHFSDSNEWYNAMLRYIKTAALWSAFGYLIGLGDRHCDNILLDLKTGEMMHIDFDCIFHRGKHLDDPEIVDFRLTPNIEAPMGFFKCFALYQYYFQIACKVFKKNISNILVALDSFIYDPLLQKMGYFDASQSFKEIEERVEMKQGIDDIITNNRNPDSLKDMYYGWLPHM